MDDFFGAFALPYLSPGYLNFICARLFDFNHWTISRFEKKNYTTNENSDHHERGLT